MELIPVAIITTIIFSFVPFLKKILIKDLDIIPFMILVGLIVVPSLIYTIYQIIVLKMLRMYFL